MLLNLERLDLLIAHYVAGALPKPADVLVGSYLEMQAAAARLASLLEGIAGEVLAGSEPLAMSNRDKSLEKIFLSRPPVVVGEKSQYSRSGLPSLLQSYAGGDLADIPWRTRLPGFRQYVIEKSKDVEASLLWLRPGRAIPHHGHKGLELTLVIEGEFHDHRGRFAAGDVSVADETLDHRPVAASRAPCICFSILFAPISLSGPIPRLVGDILGI